MSPFTAVIHTRRFRWGWPLSIVAVLSVYTALMIPFLLNYKASLPSAAPAPFLIDISELASVNTGNSTKTSKAWQSRPMLEMPDDIPEANELTAPVIHDDSLESAHVSPTAKESTNVAAPKKMPHEYMAETPDQKQEPITQTAGTQASDTLPADLMSAPMAGSGQQQISEQQITWQHVVQAYLERRKRYPRLAELRKEEGTVLVSFNMKRDGSVVSVELVKPCGHASLDKEAVALIKRASPLPSVPDAVVGDVISLTMPIAFSL